MAIFKSTQTAKKIGSDLVVCIDATIAQAAGLTVGQQIYVEVVGEGILIRSVVASRETLEQKIARFDPVLHGGEAMAVRHLGNEFC